MSDHDPLCYMYEGKWDGGCQCTLIARVRADELRHPSEDGWMSVRAVLAWEDQVRADERKKMPACTLDCHECRVMDFFGIGNGDE